MPRTLAFTIITRVEDEDAFSNVLLDALLSGSTLDTRDRGLVTTLVNGVLACRRSLDQIIAPRAHRDFSTIDPPVLRVLRMGVYQAVFLDRIPDHAILHESVELVREQGFASAAGFVNAVLRSVVQEQKVQPITWWEEEDRVRKPDRYLGQRYSLPSWLAKRLLRRFGLEQAEAFAATVNQPPPLYISLGRNALADERSAGSPVAFPETARKVEDLEELRQALADRRVWVQDLSSQFAVQFGRPQAAGRVLDACAGRGGKTASLLVSMDANATLDAVEPVLSKCEELERMTAANALPSQSIHVHQKRLQEFVMSAPQPYDLVFLDAPCTGLGVIRRHPETRWRRRQEDIDSRVALQRELLEAASALVAPGGVLLYSVCTFIQEETRDQVEWFLGAHPDFLLEPWDHDNVESTDGCLMTWPHIHDTDAFFAARFRRS